MYILFNFVDKYTMASYFMYDEWFLVLNSYVGETVFGFEVYYVVAHNKM